MGVSPPPKTTLRNWQLAVNALHAESFDVLKTVCQSTEAEVDENAVTLTYLIRKEFKDFSSIHQGLCIHILSRQVTPPCVIFVETPAIEMRAYYLIRKRSVGGRCLREQFFLPISRPIHLHLYISALFP